jgi:hypothetical protein
LQFGNRLLFYIPKEDVMSNKKSGVTFADLAAEDVAAEVYLDPKVVFLAASAMMEDPIFQQSEELAALELELAVANQGLAEVRSTNQRIGDLAIQKLHLEHAARAILLEKRGVKGLPSLPLAVRAVVEKYRMQILDMDPAYQATCAELAELHRKLEMGKFNAHLTAKVNIEAAIAAILESNNG